MEPVYKNLGKVRPTIDNNDWSIDNKYDLLTIIYDPSSNKSYISRKDVPAGVVIDNREYWLPFGIGKFVDNAIININYLDGVSQELVTYTLEEAIARIGDEDKRLGVIISFYGNEASDSHTPGWCLYQFMSDDLNDWDNVNAWNSIYYNRNKNVGWFRTESELLAIYPYPHKGDYCYVGTSLIGSYVYRCYENGTWTNTHELASANIGITIGGNIRISENGTWVVDDEDTGIKAVGTGVERMTYTPSQEDGGINVLQIKLTDGTQFSFPIKNGNQGNSGIVVPDLETFLAELVNNLTTDDGTKALSAAQGVVLDNKINQLGQYVDNPEWVRIVTDANDRILEGIKTDGTKVICGDAQIEGNAAMLGNVYIQGATYTLMQNPEWIKVIVDARNYILCGIKADGSIYLNSLTEIPTIIQDAINAVSADTASLEERITAIESIFSIVDNPEFIQVTTDSEGRVLQSRNPEGVNKEYVGIETPSLKVNDVEIADNVDAIDTMSVINDPEGRTEIKIDSQGKILSYRDSEGVMHENVGIDAKQIEAGSIKADVFNFSESNLLSIASSLQEMGVLSSYSEFLPKVLVTSDNLVVDGDNIEGLSVTKNEVACQIAVVTPTIKFTDENCTIAYQGNSTLQHPKKGFTFNFSKEYRFGDWLAFDSFHCKAYYGDWLHLRDWLVNIVIEQVYNCRSIDERRPYIKYNDFNSNNISLLLEDDPLCHTDEFPVELYINGSYWGLYSFRIKKSRGNYLLTKKNVKHIQIEAASDTYYTDTSFADGGDGWSHVEVRNPNKDSGNSSFTEGVEPNAGEIKTAWQTLISNLNAVTNNTTKAELEEFLNVPEWIDTILIYNFVSDTDVWSKNTLYTCWDSVVDLNNGTAIGHWSPLMYDFDGAFDFLIENPFTAKAYTYCPWLSTLEIVLDADIKARYRELREQKIFDYDNIYNLVKSKMKEIGKDVYSRDIQRWNYPDLSQPSPKSLSTIMNNISYRLSVMDTRYDYAQN